MRSPGRGTSLTGKFVHTDSPYFSPVNAKPPGAPEPLGAELRASVSARPVWAAGIQAVQATGRQVPDLVNLAMRGVSCDGKG